MKNTGKASKVLVFVLLSLLALTTLVPILYMCEVTLLTKEEYMLNMFSLPSSFNLENYHVVLQNFNFVQMVFNSLMISTLTVVLSLFLTSLTAYSVDKLAWKGKKFVMALITVGMFMPGQVLILPVYQILISLNMVNNRLGLVTFYVALSIPFTVMMQRANIHGISNEILEPASIDGAGHFRIYWSIVLPLLKPTLATAAILNFITYWNELLYAMILLQNEAYRTVTVSIVSMTNKFGSNPPLLYADLLLSALPVIVIYLVAQKQIIKGVSAGAVK